ncbi:solute carrier family 25 member 45 isoform X2 [Anolis carolinensis]|uniref:solute carrier family 25 member 45 isoform X2 n=1 Tax=Anolis carolinensis TaxID=28377 RepID=UPI002F2B8497
MSGVEFAAGWVSGAAGLILGHPIDTVKVRLQTQVGYRNILDCVVKTYRHETFRGFFKGMSFPLLTVAAGNSVMFGVYSNALLYLSGTPLLDRHSSPPSYLHIFMAGGMSGIAQALFLAPVDLVKVRLQNQTHIHNPKAVQPRYRGPIHCAVCILREEGLRGLFRGGMALVLRDTPTLAVYFATYTALCRGLTTEGQEPGPAAVLVAGGLAGTASWALATPMDVVKARLQMDGVKRVEYRGIMDCFLISFRREGARVFLRGLTLNSLRAFPVNAVTFLTYENLLKLLC